MLSADYELAEKFRQFKIIPVIAIDQVEDILPLADILWRNKLPVVEITFRSAAAVDAIALVRKRYPTMFIAAGTVLTKEQVIAAKNAGADCIVTPGFNPNIVQYCQILDFPIIPGVNNPMAIEAALEYGIHFVKFFPAEASGGVKMIKALLGPYPHLKIMPTGGVGLGNITDYISVSNIVACGGSWFVDRVLIQSQNWAEIERLTQEVISLVQK